MTAYKYLNIYPEHSYFVSSDRRSFIDCPATIDGHMFELIAMAGLDFSVRYTGAELATVCSSWPEALHTYTVTSLECAVHLVYDLSYCGQLVRRSIVEEAFMEEEDF